MKKFKDFLYDKNDIIIALLILIIASLLIIWRMDAIMEYPKTLISDTGSTSTEVGSGEEDGQVQGGEEGGQASGQSSEGDGDDDGSAELWVNGVLNKSVVVNVSGASASEAVECLVTAGLFDNYADYQAVCTSAGLDHQKVSAGTFEFNKGWSKADIAKAVNWS